mgnify:CR=1 FL=1
MQPPTEIPRKAPNKYLRPTLMLGESNIKEIVMKTKRKHKKPEIEIVKIANIKDKPKKKKDPGRTGGRPIVEYPPPGKTPVKTVGFHGVH